MKPKKRACFSNAFVFLFSIFCCGTEMPEISNSQQILVCQFCKQSVVGFRGCSACSLANYHKYDLFQIQVHKNTRDREYVITSPALYFGHTCTRNKFQISLILNLLAHLEAFVYQNCHLLRLFLLMWSLNSLSVSRCWQFHIVIVSCQFHAVF